MHSQIQVKGLPQSIEDDNWGDVSYLVHLQVVEPTEMHKVDPSIPKLNWSVAKITILFFGTSTTTHNTQQQSERKRPASQQQSTTTTSPTKWTMASAPPSPFEFMGDGLEGRLIQKPTGPVWVVWPRGGGGHGGTRSILPSNMARIDRDPAHF